MYTGPEAQILTDGFGKTLGWTFSFVYLISYVLLLFLLSIVFY